MQSNQSVNGEAQKKKLNEAEVTCHSPRCVLNVSRIHKKMYLAGYTTAVKT
jgi:hypothetical protein